jgi:hypothetical protein
VIERRQPSLLVDGSILITGEVDRTTDFEQGMPPAHQHWTGTTWEPDPLILDDQALVANVRGKGLVIVTGCGHAGAVNIVRHAQRLTGVPGCMHCSAACTWAAPSLPRASAPRPKRSPNWHPTSWYPDTAPAGEHNTPSPPRYPTAGSKAAAAPATSSPLPYLPGSRTWPVRDMARRAIVEYIAWYNGTLLHSTLGYRRPPNSNKETRSRSSLTESSALSSGATPVAQRARVRFEMP